MKSQRRVSCRDLGKGDCEGWLWRKNTSPASNNTLSSKWSKRWVVIKDGGIHSYRSNDVDDDRRAESYISLPGYQVAPATGCKRKFAFTIAHPKRKTFYFAAERQMDMSRWMNKMGLAAIEYKYDGGSHDSTPSKDEDYFSESENDDLSDNSGSRNSTGSCP
uniref:PH domain-containing protein n=2 Tax=Ciona savignyi TaxID=51511 RepID=H2YEM8_CIOSA